MTTDVAFLKEVLKLVESAVRAGARVHPQAAAAHAANESAFGRSGLTHRARNLFGVKAVGKRTAWWDGSTVSMPTWEVVDGRDVTVEASFRSYPTWAESIADYADIISRVYPSAASATRDVTFLAGLFLTGPRKWATDPRAFDKAVRLLVQYEDVLYADGELRPSEKVVLDQLTWADRLAVLRGRKVVMLGRFLHRVRGEKLDVRRA